MRKNSFTSGFSNDAGKRLGEWSVCEVGNIQRAAIVVLVDLEKEIFIFSILGFLTVYLLLFPFGTLHLDGPN